MEPVKRFALNGIDYCTLDDPTDYGIYLYDTREPDGHGDVVVSGHTDPVTRHFIEAVAKTASDHDAALHERNERIAELEAELTAYRNGGITEEMLRRNDGSIKVGRGCMVVREEDWARMQESEELVMEILKP